VVKVADDLITMKSKTAGEALVPYGMAVWSAGIGTHPVIMDFMHQIGQVVARRTSCQAHLIIMSIQILLANKIAPIFG
jgi:NADH dehydrogenase FAD-containing subunit